MHGAAVTDLQLADDRNIIFALAGDNAGAATGADVQVDRHAPLLRRLERRVGVDGRQLSRQLIVPRDLFHEFVVFAVMFEGRFAHQ